MKITKRISSLLPIVAISFAASADDGIVAIATSSVFRVETSLAGSMTAGSNAAIAFAPRYQTSAPDEGSYVVLKRVDRPDTAYATTSVVYTCASGQEGDFEIGSGSSQGGYVRFLHELHTSDGLLAGDVLAGDVAFPMAEASSSAVIVDSRPGAFQSVAESGAEISLAYDSSWCTNGSPAYVEICRVKDRFRGGELRSSITSHVVKAASPSAGGWSGQESFAGGGTFTYMLNFLTESGARIGEGFSARCRFDEIWGMHMILK